MLIDNGLFDLTTYLGVVIGPDDAEVDTDTYLRDKSDPQRLYAINVEYTLDDKPKSQSNVKPYWTNIKQIPYVGEAVIIFETFSSNSSSTTGEPQWYYMNPIGIQSNVNNNIIPNDGLTLDPEFKDTPISPLQPYRGDLMIEGRWGNSIRFGSTIKFKNNYSVNTSWSGGSVGDPITVISNGQDYKSNRDFVTERIDTDPSSLYLTSTQHLDHLTLSKELTKFGPFRGSQFVGVADRSILRAKTEAAIIDADEAVILNTPGQVLIGGDDADKGIPQGDILIEIITSLVRAIGSGVAVSGVTGTTLGADDILNVLKLLEQLNSKNYFIKGN